MIHLFAEAKVVNTTIVKCRIDRTTIAEPAVTQTEHNLTTARERQDIVHANLETALTRQTEIHR